MIDLLRGGRVQSLDDGTLSFLISYDGIGLVPLRRHTDQGPLQHGATDTGFQLDPRVFSLGLRLVGLSRADLYSKRRDLLSLLAPGPDPIALRWTLEGGTVRQIDCHAIETLYELPGGFVQRLVVSFMAPDPTFYDPDPSIMLFGLGYGATGFTVPHPVPHYVGTSVLDARQVANYEGDIIGYPGLIRITGPVTGLILTNERTGELLDFTGQIIEAGHYIEINLLPESGKTVVDDLGADRTAWLTDGSDLAIWHLEPGNNSLRATGTGTTGASRIEIVWLNRYSGQ